MWWTLVAIYLLVLFSVFSLVAKQLSIAAKSFGLVAGTLAGFFIQVVLSIAAPNSNAITRGAWDSNIYGGRFVDFLVSSPVMNALLPGLESLKPGASVELSQVGILGAALGILSIVTFILAIFRNASLEVRGRVLASLAAATTLLFVSGGLGNLQAGLLLFVGIESPARVWARLIILLAVIGAGLFLLSIEKLQKLSSNYAERWRSEQSKIVFNIILPVVILALALPDFFVTRNTESPVAFAQLPEFSAVAFIESRAGDQCPVLQLPVESMPMPMSSVPEHYPDTYYRGLVPYLMKPSVIWSFGDYQREGRAAYLDQLGPEILSTSVYAIYKAGFCFVLFDKSLSDISKTYSLNLPGTSVGDHFGEPLFTSERFDVYSVPTN
jgi:hypothetical protein